jgi:hypothetical protein
MASTPRTYTLRLFLLFFLGGSFHHRPGSAARPPQKKGLLAMAPTTTCPLLALALAKSRYNDQTGPALVVATGATGRKAPSIINAARIRGHISCLPIGK